MQPIIKNDTSRIVSLFKKLSILVFTLLSIQVVFANPSGGVVTNGNATITQNGNTVTIQQNSRQAIIQWKSFNIGAHEATRFQQIVNGIALNRIDPNQGMSQIFGLLSATGRIILINPAGIYFGSGAVINVGGMIASTANISNANFLADKFIFDQPSTFPGASIINEGTIKAADYGLIALLGSTVTNNGYIQAKLGSIVLATGSKFTFDFYGDQLINFSVDAPTESGGKITNTGTLLADGGKILVTAQAAQGVLDNVIDMEGVAQAHSVAQQNGEIILMASNGGIKVGGELTTSGNGAQGGDIQISAPQITITSTGMVKSNGSLGGGNITLTANNFDLSGKISARGYATGALGGNIQITAANINLSHATVDASGAAGGGTIVLQAPTTASKSSINIDGESAILADALTTGQAGTITLQSSQTLIAGKLSVSGLGQGTKGGTLQIQANSLLIAPGAMLIASGDTAGGNIQINSDDMLVAGKLDASGTNTGSSGGLIQLNGNQVTIQSLAELNASGNQFGGEILLGGNPATQLSTQTVNINAGSVLNVSAYGNNNSIGGLIQIYAVNTNVNGTLDASAPTINSNGLGGEIKIFAQNTINIGPNANILALGDAGGGQILIGGDEHGAGVDPNAQFTNVAASSVINASALNNGTGGNVVVWSDITTNFFGAIIARGGAHGGNGGQVEVSGEQKLNYHGTVDLRAPQGTTGTLTLDPQNITIQDAGASNPNSDNSILTVADLESELAMANVLVITRTTGSEPGDITVANNVTWDNTNTLTLSAYRNINVNANITNNAGGSLVLNADNTRNGVGTINFAGSGHVTMTGGGQVSFYYEPSNYNFRYPNFYYQNVTTGNGTTVSFNPLNFVNAQLNSAIISTFSVVPNIMLNLGIASIQQQADIIVPVENRVVVAMDNNLETVTEEPQGFSVKIMDNPDGSTKCEKAACVSKDFVIE